MATEPLNLLFIQADQLKPQVLGCYGGPALTPHIDALARRGTLFESAYCNFPLCAPSRFSMLSGLLPSRIGAYDNGAEYRAEIPTIAHYLRTAGYRTVLAGKQHFVGPDQLHGFHARLVPELYPTDFAWTPLWGETRMESNNDATGVTRAGVCVRSAQMDHDEATLYRATAQLHDFARDRRQPFFLAASFTHPHEPYYCEQQYWDRYEHDEIPMPVTVLQPEPDRLIHTQRMLEHHGLLDERLHEEATRTARHAYLGNVSYFDDMVGRLLKLLDDTGMTDRTAIVLTADHGDMLGEHGLWFKKHFLEDCARVPLLVVMPGATGDYRSPANVSLVDVLPTLCDLAGVDAGSLSPQPLDGISLLPACDGAATLFDRPVYAEITSESVPAPMFMVRRGRHKLITGGDAPDALFVLDSDPQELVNKAVEPGQAGIHQSLRDLASAQWNVPSLTQDITRSQRRRRLVDLAHQDGQRVRWEAAIADPTTPWLLREEGLYNGWAWRGIDED